MQTAIKRHFSLYGNLAKTEVTHVQITLIGRFHLARPIPNARSRPQIVDLGVIGSRQPIPRPDSCDRCGACVETCKEGAIDLLSKHDLPVLDTGNCLCCWSMYRYVPSGAIREQRVSSADWRQVGKAPSTRV
jgi:ferredoxin